MATSRVGASEPEVGQLEEPSGKDDGRREQKRETRGLLVPKTRHESRCHRDPRAGNAGDQGARLEEADDHCRPQTQAVDALVRRVVLLMSEHWSMADSAASLVPASEQLGGQEDAAIDDQKCRSEARVREERLERVLQEESDNARGNRSNDQHDRQTLIGTVDAALQRSAEKADHDPGPVAPVQNEQCRGSAEVQYRKHRDECGAALLEMEPDERWHDHRMTERRNREELRDSLQRGEEEDQPGAQHRPEPTSPSRVV